MNELQDFQGTWQAVWLADDGRKRAAEDVKRTRVTVAGDRYTLHLGDFVFHGTITAIDTTRNRGPVDFLGTGGPRTAGKRFLGIYILEDDELTICVAPAGQERPTTFASREGSGHWLYLLKRHVPSRVRPLEEVLS